jgi:uncharacterized glyoxalase superfamily protein PhnB
MKSVVGYIDILYLPVLDFEEAIKWYEEKLGFYWNGICFNLGQGPAIMLITVNNEDEVKLTYKSDFEGNDYDQHLLSFKSDNIEEAYETLKERGVSVSELKTYDENRKNFRFYDLYGNRFDVWQPIP